jgi:hypothetical protein|tara:strand:+ start:2825 stop:3283 length:459 start_codon:yes stop_codon:yes gene_type:complete
MNLYIEGYRSHNHTLDKLLTAAVWYYGIRLLGGRMARHVELDLKLTKNLYEKEKSYGYCSIAGEMDNPREFLIELDASMKHPFDQILIWLAHEMVHLKQFVRGELFDYETGSVQWKSKRYSRDTNYSKQPWEKEAYRLEEKLYKEFAEWYYE